MLEIRVVGIFQVNRLSFMSDLFVEVWARDFCGWKKASVHLDIAVKPSCRKFQYSHRLPDTELLLLALPKSNDKDHSMS